MSLKQVIIFILSLVVTIYTLFVAGSLVAFLSTPRKTAIVYTWVFNLLDNKSKWEIVFGPLFYDYLYLAGFILQHSIMKSELIKSIFKLLHLTSIERILYNLTSSLCLHYLVQNWMAAESIVLWQVNTNDSPIWWTFVLVHIFAWFIIFGGSLLMDAPEMIGLTQTNNSQSMSYKSYEMRHLYAHVRHPSFVGFVVILCVTNLMTIDRLLLAIMLTGYMYIAWSTDRSDVIYQKYNMLRRRSSIRSR